MKFFLDHDVPHHVADALVRHGHEAAVLQDELPTTSSDEEVLAHAIATNRILITCNRDDFLQLAKDVAHPGLIILIRRHSAVSERGHVLKLLETAGEPGLTANINFA